MLDTIILGSLLAGTFVVGGVGLVKARRSIQRESAAVEVLIEEREALVGRCEALAAQKEELTVCVQQLTDARTAQAEEYATLECVRDALSSEQQKAEQRLKALQTSTRKLRKEKATLKKKLKDAEAKLEEEEQRLQRIAQREIALREAAIQSKEILNFATGSTSREYLVQEMKSAIAVLKSALDL